MPPPRITFYRECLKLMVMRRNQHDALPDFCLAHAVMSHAVGGHLREIILDGIIVFQLWFSLLLEVNDARFILIDADQVGNAPVVITKM